MPVNVTSFHEYPAKKFTAVTKNLSVNKDFARFSCNPPSGLSGHLPPLRGAGKPCGVSTSLAPIYGGKGSRVRGHQVSITDDFLIYGQVLSRGG